jgi:hypothetical protein
MDCLERIREVKIVRMRLVFVCDNKTNDIILLGSDYLIYLPTNRKSNLKSAEGKES